MKILAIDSSGNVASVAVLEDEKLLGEMSTNYKKTHSQTLLPMIHQLCQMIDLDLNSLDYIATASGPGSFTGLRIGASTAKGLAFALNKPVVAVPTLDGLAYNIVYSDHLICPIMDARRNQVYTAYYLWEEDSLKRQSEYMAIDIENCLEKVKVYNRPVIFLGDAVPVYKETIKEKMEDVKYFFAPPSCNMQRAASVGSLAFVYVREGKIQSAMEFVPFYLRKSQAEREYEEKNKE